jgi:hypothetical protein
MNGWAEPGRSGGWRIRREGLIRDSVMTGPARWTAGCLPCGMCTRRPAAVLRVMRSRFPSLVAKSVSAPRGNEQLLGLLPHQEKNPFCKLMPRVASARHPLAGAGRSWLITALGRLHPVPEPSCHGR